MSSAQHSDITDAPAVSRTTLQVTHLAPAHQTAAVEIRRIALGPGFVGGFHLHNGPVFGSVETGSAVYQVEGSPEVVLGPGDVFYEPEGARIARFDARAEGVTFLGYFLLADGVDAGLVFPES